MGHTAPSCGESEATVSIDARLIIESRFADNTFTLPLFVGICRSSNEVILADENSNLYEGMSSNFAIIDKDNRLITAPNSVVLMGTIMEVVKIVAAELGLTVVEELPTLQTLASCRGAFITSTSRLLLPIGLIITPDGSEVRFERSSPPPAGEGESADATMHMLQLGVLQKIIERSTDIIIV